MQLRVTPDILKRTHQNSLLFDCPSPRLCKWKPSDKYGTSTVVAVKMCLSYFLETTMENPTRYVLKDYVQGYKPEISFTHCRQATKQVTDTEIK